MHTTVRRGTLCARVAAPGAEEVLTVTLENLRIIRVFALKGAKGCGLSYGTVYIDANLIRRTR